MQFQSTFDVSSGGMPFIVASAELRIRVQKFHGKLKESFVKKIADGKKAFDAPINEL